MFTPCIRVMELAALESFTTNYTPTQIPTHFTDYNKTNPIKDMDATIKLNLTK